MKIPFCIQAVVVLAALTLAGCAHTARISSNLDFGSRPPDLTVITLKVKNQDMRATTPLLIDVSLQLRRGQDWGKPASVIHPAAFVLNKQEEQILRSTVKLRGEAIRATVSVKEQETGKTVSTEQFEKVLSGT